MFEKFLSENGALAGIIFLFSAVFSYGLSSSAIYVLLKIRLLRKLTWNGLLMTMLLLCIAISTALYSVLSNESRYDPMEFTLPVFVVGLCFGVLVFCCRLLLMRYTNDEKL